MSTVSDALGILDEARATVDDVGLRPFQVFIRTIEWSGLRIGDGNKNVTTTELTVARGRRPKVVVLTDKDIVAGGVRSATRYQIGPITPPHAGGGTSTTTLDPAARVAPTEVFYVIVGPGCPVTGMLCKKVSDKLDSPFRYMVTVESLGRPADATP